MRTRNSLSSCLGAVWALPLLALFLCLASPLAADEKNPIFQEIEGLTVPPVKFPKGDGVAIPGAFDFQKPLEIVKRKELKTILGKGKDMMTLRKSVDFEKQKVLLFRWNGSGKDTLTVRLAGKDQAKPKLFFDYTSGLTREVQFHAKVFVLRNDAQWEVVRAKPAVAKARIQVVPKPVPLVREKGAVVRIQAQAAVEVKPGGAPKPPAPPGAAGVIRGGLKPGVALKRPIPINRAARSMRIYKQWTGFLPNGVPSIDLPASGYVDNEETWVELWHAWRPTEKIPTVDFRNELVLVGALPNKLRVYVRALKTEDGAGTISINGSGNAKGLSYSFAKVMRAGLISINGARLPGAPD